MTALVLSEFGLAVLVFVAIGFAILAWIAWTERKR
jgi:hypothetical protein